PGHGPGTAVRAVLHHQGAGLRPGPVDLQIDHLLPSRHADAHARPDRRRRLRHSAARGGLMGQARPTVYVVDDEEPVGDSIAMLLQSVGLKTSVYRDAKGFLEDYQAGSPGCLLLDV